MIPAAFAGLNPRYALYCVAQGYATPAEARERDEGSMCGFICWNTLRLAQFKGETGRAYADASYDPWLCDFVRAYVAAKEITRRTVIDGSVTFV